MFNNKRLPPPPGASAITMPEVQHVDLTVDEVRYSTTQRFSPGARNTYKEPSDGHEKSFHTVSGHAMPPRGTRTTKGSNCKAFENWWPWEWLCELLAVGSLGAMVLVLLLYHGKPQAEWRQSYFTLNGLIAFLATLTKTGLIIPVSAAIGQRKWLRFLPNKKGERKARRLGDFEMFDEASRGSIGSTKLIFSLNAWDVTCLGAFVTIVSVFFSAITQNVLGTYVSMQDGRSLDLVAGKVPRSEYFNLTDQPPNSELTFEDQFSIDVSALAAIYNGIISDKIDDVPISCATGNCTWPIIPTAGICGACMDMKDEVITNCGGGSMSQEGGCYFSIPGGTNLTKPTSLALANDTTPLFIAGPGSNFIFNQTEIVGEGVIREKMSFNFIGQSYAQFIKANRGSWVSANRTLFNMANVLAYECGLWNCIQSRSVNASNGIVIDTMLDFRNGDGPDPTSFAFHFQDDPSFNIDNITSYDMTDKENAALYGMQATLDSALSGSITVNGLSTIDFTPTLIREPSFGTRYGVIDGLTGSSIDCLHAAWVYADDIDKWWARLAKSLTNNVRMNGKLRQEEHDRYDGIAWTEVVHIEVRWLWLVFPASLVLLSSIFLVATMIASWQSGIKPWKSFILPVLYSRLEDGLQEEWKQEFISDSGSLAEVKHRWAELGDTNDAWTFRHVTKDSYKGNIIHYTGDVSMDTRLGTAE